MKKAVLVITRLTKRHGIELFFERFRKKVFVETRNLFQSEYPKVSRKSLKKTNNNINII